MSEPTDNTPFLSGNDHDEEESHFIKTLPANSYFKRSLKIIAALDLVLSILVFALLIVNYVYIKTGPFSGYTYNTEETIRDLSIALFINFLLSAPTVFLPLPIWLNLAAHLTMSIVVLVFSGKIFGRGWPNSGFCRRWSGPPDYRNLPETYNCRHSRDIIKINLAVAAGFGIFIGLLLLTKLLLRIIAVAKSNFWQKYASNGVTLKPSGFTVQFTLSILPNDSNRSAVGAVTSSADDGLLVET